MSSCLQAFYTHIQSNIHEDLESFKNRTSKLSVQYSSVSDGILSSDFPSKHFISISQIRTKQNKQNKNISLVDIHIIKNMWNP